MTDERTLATEIRELFRDVASQQSRRTREGWAVHFDVEEGSEQFYMAIAAVRRNIDQLRRDIEASPLKAGSKSLYVGAVNTFARYVTLAGLMETTTKEIAQHTQAFEYLTLVDDFLEPLDHRDVPKKTIEEIRDRIAGVLSDLDTVDMDDRLKAFVRSQISTLLWAIDHFNLIGIDGVCRTYGAAHAEIMRSFGFRGAKSPAAQGWFKKALPALAVVGGVITTASAVVEHTDNLLTHGESIYHFIAGDFHAIEGPEVDVQVEINGSSNHNSNPPLLPNPDQV